MEPAPKRIRSERTDCKRQTVYVYCSTIGSRHELVNGFLYHERERLGIESLYSGDHLQPDAPVEVVFVKNSRKPYFLLEFRYPTDEEIQRRHGDLPSGADDEGHAVGGASVVYTDDELEGFAQAVLALGASSSQGFRHKDELVTISLAMEGTTVASERRKLELRDKVKKTERQKQAEEAKHLNGAGERPLAMPPKKAPTPTSFVPRAVRRQV